MVQSSVRVVLRTRPTSKPSPNLEISSDGQTITFRGARKHIDMGQSTGETADNIRFRFDTVLHNADQESVFEQTAVEVLDSALQGFNGTVMCYGQTGAGKTYTMSGGKESYKARGIIPRAIAYLFKTIEGLEGQGGGKYTVRVSYLEVYNESLYDLLDPTSDPATLAVQEDRSGSISLRGLSSPTCLSQQDAMRWLFEGEQNRAIGEHDMNKASSRSHAVFTMYIEAVPGTDDDSRRFFSKVHMVDLAGSERLAKTRSEGGAQREAQHINRSLSFLEQVVMALGERNREHVPYRSSRLTYLLKDSLGGNCKTVLVANVWGEEAQVEETVSTCRFAQRMMRVSNEIVQNVKQESSVYIKKLEREIEDLRQELALHDTLAGRGQVAHVPYGAEQKAKVRASALEFLSAPPEADSIAPLDLLSARHVREILHACRALYKEATARAAQPPASLPATGAGGGGAAGAAPGA